MQIQKWIKIKLFYNESNRTHYVQLGDAMLFMVKTTTALSIQDKEGLEIRHCKDLKDMQMMSLDDDKIIGGK